MFSKLVVLSAAILGFLSQTVNAYDATREVYITEGQNLMEFCDTWNDECIRLAHRAGKAYDRCGAGYDGEGTARVDCLALNGETPAPDYTVQVATALNVTFVA